MTTDSPFTILGQRTTGSIDAEQLETFPTPDGVQYVTFETTELTAFCPITHQPDFYRVFIEFAPRERCLESKSLKLYLMSFRERGMFAEALSAELADALYQRLEPKVITVTVHQQPRGGLELTASAQRP